MSTPPGLAQLLRVLDDRSLGLGHDDVAWAFESSKTKAAISSWVREYLSPSTLLTGEEAFFVEKLGSPGITDAVAGPLISDQDFDSAINVLEASTASLEKQCKLLEAQKKALQEIQARNASNPAESIKAQRSSKFKREEAQAEFEASELTESLRLNIGRTLKQSENATDSIHSAVERMLEKDDRLFDGLQKVIPQLSDVAVGASQYEEVEKLCQALTAYSSAEIHARIDAAFQSAAQSSGNPTNGTRPPSTSSQNDSLRAELEELCREIDGLSAMAIDNQYRNPITKALGIARSNSDSDKVRWLEYTSNTLQYLTHRLECLEDSTLQSRSRSSVLKTVLAAFDGVLAIPVDRKQSSQTHTQSSSKVSSRGLKPLRLVQANLSESQEPAAQLLRHLDVRASDSRDSFRLSQSLIAANKDKNDKISMLSSRTEENITDQLSRSVAQADASANALLSGVYAYSPYERASLVDSSAAEGIDQLEQKTQSLGDEMRELDLEKVRRLVKLKQQALMS